MKLSRILCSKGIPHKLGRVIWYTRADYYTPDFMIGNRLIIESNLSTLKMHIDDFNRYFSSLSVNVEESEVKTECIYSMEKMDNNSQFSWLREW